MGVGQSRVGPANPENDDISLKSTEDKSSQKKKRGVMRFIIDAFLGETSPTPSPGGCGFPPYPESPESGADFDVETFVDAPLPAARQGNDVKSERRVTPGRARSKRRNITSKCGILPKVRVIEEQSRPLDQDGEVETLKPTEDESTKVNSTRLDAHPKSDGSNESLEVPWSHGRGDNTPSVLATACSNVDTVTHQTPDVLKSHYGSCHFQSNSSENIPASDTNGSRDLSDKYKCVGGGEAQLKVEKDTNTLAIKGDTTNILPITADKKACPITKGVQGVPRLQTGNTTMFNSKRLEMFTVEKRKGPPSLEDVSTAGNKVLRGSEQGKSKQKQVNRKIATAFPPFEAPVHQDLLCPSRFMTKKATTASQVGPIDGVVKRPVPPVADIDKNKGTTKGNNVGTPLCVVDSKADSMHAMDRMGEKETPDIEPVVPGVHTIFQTQIPTVVDLRDAVKDARKELDSIEKYLRTSLKRGKMTNVADKQGGAEAVKQNKSSAPSSLESTGGNIKSSCDQTEVLQGKPFLCPVFDEPIPRSVVFKGKKGDTNETSEGKFIQCKEFKDGRKQPSLSTVAETSRGEAFVPKQRPSLARLVSRKGLKKKTSPRPPKTPSGSDKHPETSSSKGPLDPAAPCVDHCCDAAAVMVPIHGASASEDEEVNRRNFLYIQKQGKLPKPSEDPLQPNEVFAAYVDGNMHSLEMMLQRPLTRDDLNNALYLLRQVLPRITESMKKYFPIPSTSNARGLCVTKITDGDFSSMFPESLTWWERKRPGVLFNSKFYPRRLILPYFEKVGNDIELTAKNYHAHGVQYLPIIGNYQEIEGAADGIMINEGEAFSSQRPVENKKVDVPIKSVKTSREHSTASLRFPKERLKSALAELGKLATASFKSQSAAGHQATPCNFKLGEVLHWYREVNKLSLRMISIENTAKAGASVCYESDLFLAECNRVLKQFDAWKQQNMVGKKSKESSQSRKKRDTKQAEKRMTTVVQNGAENANVQPDHDSEQRPDDAKAAPNESPKTINPPLNQELVRDLKTDVNGNEMATELTVRMAADMNTNIKKDEEKTEERPEKTVSGDHDGVTTAVASKDDDEPDREVTKSLTETGKDGTVHVKDGSFGREDTKLEVKSQIVSGDHDDVTSAAAPKDDSEPDGEVPKLLTEAGKDGTIQVKDGSFNRRDSKSEVKSQTVSGQRDGVTTLAPNMPKDDAGPDGEVPKPLTETGKDGTTQVKDRSSDKEDTKSEVKSQIVSGDHDDVTATVAPKDDSETDGEVPKFLTETGKDGTMQVKDGSFNRRDNKSELKSQTVSGHRDGVTTTLAPNMPKDDAGPDEEVPKPLTETGKEGTILVKDWSSDKEDTKSEVKSQTVSGERESAAGAEKGLAKKKLGRGPRIVGDMRRIVHCQRRRRTETPTTQLKIKFCLGCGDTRQPNGEPLIQCATCDEAFFCCTKCQRDTRNEHRETCKGVKRNYCRHW